MNYSMGYAGNNYSHGPASGHYHGYTNPPQQESVSYDQHRMGDGHEMGWPQRCNSCGNFAEIFCPRCENVGYCSEAHLLEDEMNHRANCWPEQNFTEVNRLPDSHTVLSISSSNNIQAGQTVAKIRPIMMAPHDKNLSGPPKSSLCFGCCKWFPVGSCQCSMCGWPVCSVHCETNSLHSTYECEIFHMANVSWSMFAEVYDIVLVLRCILMLENSNDESSIRQAFRDWNLHKVNPMFANTIIVVPDQLQTASETFLHKISQLNFMDKNWPSSFIQQVLSFVHGNSLCQENRASTFDSNHIRNYHSAKYVIPHKFAYGQSCNPNVTWTMNYSPNLRECNLHLWTTNGLKIGDKLKTCFYDIFPHLGTRERRRLQMLNDQRKCECPRCKDPTELNSYASAIKCRNCMEGYILPENPLEDESIWKCDNVSCRLELESTIVLNRFQQIIQDINNAKQCIDSLMNLITKLQFSLHQQHYLIAQAADCAVELACADVKNKTFESLHSYSFQPVYKAARLCLNFADAVSPGLTKHRAKYIFVLQMIHGLAETHNAVYHFKKDEFVEGRLIREKFDNIHLYQVEFQKIVQFDKPGSLFYSLFDALAKSRDDLAELLRTTAQRRAFDGYELERLKKAFSYFTKEVYEPNVPQALRVDVGHIIFYLEPTPFRLEFKTFFGC